MTTMEELVGLYVSTRDKIKAIEAEHKEQLAPYRQGLDDVERLIMTMLNAAGADSMKTAAGTAYKAPWTKASIQDWQKVIDYAVENGRFDLFERRVAKTVVEEIGDVPGIEIERGVRVNVRRS
jgi:NADP-dependent 3-hydroxy acid dehydrogenase YdfG